MAENEMRWSLSRAVSASPAPLQEATSPTPDDVDAIEVAGHRFVRNVHFTDMYPNQRWLRREPGAGYHYAGCDEWLDRIASLTARVRTLESAARAGSPLSQSPTADAREWYCAACDSPTEGQSGYLPSDAIEYAERDGFRYATVRCANCTGIIAEYRARSGPPETTETP